MLNFLILLTGDIDWCMENMLHEFGISEIGTPRPQTPSAVADVPPAVSMPPR